MKCLQLPSQRSWGHLWCLSARAQGMHLLLVMLILDRCLPADAAIWGQGEDFRFYKSGIYDQKKCSPKLKRLDHAVIVSGCALQPASFTYQISIYVQSSMFLKLGSVKLPWAGLIHVRVMALLTGPSGAPESSRALRPERAAQQGKPWQPDDVKANRVVRWPAGMAERPRARTTGSSRTRGRRSGATAATSTSRATPTTTAASPRRPSIQTCALFDFGQKP